MTTEELCKEIVNRIGDHLNDPEPVHDALLECLTPHLIQQLQHGCRMAITHYERFGVQEQ